MQLPQNAPIKHPQRFVVENQNLNQGSIQWRICGGGDEHPTPKIKNTVINNCYFRHEISLKKKMFEFLISL